MKLKGKLKLKGEFKCIHYGGNVGKVPINNTINYLIVDKASLNWSSYLLLLIALHDEVIWTNSELKLQPSLSMQNTFPGSQPALYPWSNSQLASFFRYKKYSGTQVKPR